MFEIWRQSVVFKLPGAKAADNVGCAPRKAHPCKPHDLSRLFALRSRTGDEPPLGATPSIESDSHSWAIKAGPTRSRLNWTNDRQRRKLALLSLSPALARANASALTKATRVKMLAVPAGDRTTAPPHISLDEANQA
jgi:hypothetical protein